MVPFDSYIELVIGYALRLHKLHIFVGFHYFELKGKCVA